MIPDLRVKTKAKINDQCKIQIFGANYFISVEQAVKIICWVYDWELKDVFKKRAVVLPYWINRAMKSKKLTIDKALLIRNYLTGEYKKKRFFSFLK